MKIHFTHSPTKQGEDAFVDMSSLYNHYSYEEADVVVSLGGDGHILHTLYEMDSADIKPIFGMNRGSVGFLLNEFKEGGLIKRIKNAHAVDIMPLQVTATTVTDECVDMIAFNEITIYRHATQAAKFEIKVDGKTYIDELIADGCIVSTPAGSTAYNLSAGGPIVPLDSGLLAMTAVCPFRPRHWRSALLRDISVVDFNIHETEKRQVNVSADNRAICNVKTVTVKQSTTKYKLLHDADNTYYDRILAEQFSS